MELPKSLIRRDRHIQLIRQDCSPLTMMNIIKCQGDDINDLDEVIDIEKKLWKDIRKIH